MTGYGGNVTDTGVWRGLRLPTGGETGNTLSNWLGGLHMGHVGGWPWRVFVAATGLIVTLLSVTGVVIWASKWHGRSKARRQRVAVHGR